MLKKVQKINASSEITDNVIIFILLFIFVVLIAFGPSTFAGVLVNPQLTPIDSSAGATNMYKIEFTTSSVGNAPFVGLYNNSAIQIYIWGDFNLTGVLMAVSDSSSMTGGLIVRSVVSTPNPQDSSIVILERDGTGNYVPGNTTVRIRIANVINPTVPGTNYHVLIRTYSSYGGTEIDSDNYYDIFAIVPAAPNHFSLSGYPIQISAGSAWPDSFSIIVRDKYNNQITNFSTSLTITFSSTDNGALTTFPADSLITGTNIQSIKFPGSRFRLTRSGGQIVTVADRNDATVKTATNPINVIAAAINSFNLSTPVGVRAGEQFNLNVTGAVDLFGNQANGSITVVPYIKASTAPDGTRPNFQAISVFNGIGSARQTLYAAEWGVRLRGFIGSVADTTNAFYVGSGLSPGGFSITGYPDVVTSGQSFGTNNVTVTALDTWGNTMHDDYTGTISFSSTDTGPGTSLPPAYTYQDIEEGSHIFPGTAFTLSTVGVQTFTVTSGTVSEQSNNISVISGNIADFNVTVATSQVAGIPFACTISNAIDAQGNPANGTVAMTFNDAGNHQAPDGTQPNLPTITVINGAGNNDLVLYLAESGVVLRATGNGHVETTSAITVMPGTAVSEFTMQGYPTNLTAGTNFGTNNVNVIAYDTWNNIKTNYTGAVYFTSSDANAVLPYTAGSRYTFQVSDNGQKIFNGTSFVLRTTGQQTITVTDGTIAEVSNNISVQSGAIVNFNLGVATSQVAGVAFTVTVSNAVDTEGNAANGNISIAFSDGGGHGAPNGTLPNLQNITVLNGTGSATQVLYLAESGVVLRATAEGGQVETTPAITIAPGTDLNSFTMSGYPTSQVAGVGFGTNNVTVSAYDRWDNLKTNYTGSVYFVSTDANATLPYTIGSRYTFLVTDSGRRTFAGTGFNLRTIGQQTITITNGPVSKTSSNILVTSSEIISFNLNVSTSQVAGVSFPSTITNAKDAAGNDASGTIFIGFNDGGGHVAPNGTQPGLQSIFVTAGTGSANQVLYLAEPGVVLRATANGNIVTSNPITVAPGTALHSFTMTGYPASRIAGTDFGGNNIVVSAYDAWNNLKTNFTGAVYFQSSDANATLPYTSSSRYTFILSDNGQKTFPGTSFTLTTAGQQTITITNGTIQRSSDYINVTSGPIARFQFVVVGAATAGQPFQLRVVDAYDDYNNLTGGTVDISALSGGGVALNGQMPIYNDIKVVDGSGSNQQVLVRAVPTVLQGNSGGASQVTGTITVTPWNLNYFVISGVPDTVNAGAPFSSDTTVTITAFDIYGNQKTNYTGTIQFSSITEATAILPGNSQFQQIDQGQRYFNGSQFQYNTVGNQTFTVTDNNARVSGTSDIIVVQNPDRFVITSITPSQDKVTRGQTNPWYIDVTLQNTGVRDIIIDFNPANTFIQFFKGATNVTAEYTLIRPTQFVAGGTVLGANNSQTIRYQVTRTGTTIGDITITARVQSVNGIVTSSSSDNVYGGVQVQEQENIIIEKIWTSQPTVTQNDALWAWQVGVQIHNTGGSLVDIDFLMTDIQIDNNTGFTWRKPANLTYSENDTLGIGAIDTLIFTITRTGSTLGTRTITARVYFSNLNTGQVASVTTPTGTEAQVIVQSPANLEIISVTPSQPTITQTIQGNWYIDVLLRNNGQSSIRLRADTTYLRIEKETIEQMDFTIVIPTAFVGSNNDILPGGGEDLLRFHVTRTGHEAGILVLLPKVFGIELNTGRLVGDDATGIVTSQERASLSYIQGSLSPMQVSQGCTVAFTIRVRNSGGSTLILSDVGTKISFTAGTEMFQSFLNPNYVTGIQPGDTTLTFTARELSPNAALGFHNTQVALIGKENNNIYNSGIFPDQVEVIEAGELEILQMQASQRTITSGQTRPWYVDMEIVNNGGAGIRLDSAKIDFHRLKEDLTDKFSFSSPDHFLSGGTDELAGGTKDTLRFTINSVDLTVPADNIRIQGHIWVVDVNRPDRHLERHSNGNSAFILTQSPANIVVKTILPSQPGISPGQNRDWTIRVAVENQGGSDVLLNPVITETFLKFQAGNGHFRVIHPDRFTNSDSTLLKAGRTDYLNFRVDSVSTAITPGNCNIDIQIRVVEINSNRPITYDSQVNGGTGSVLVESPPALRVEAVQTVSPRSGFINSNQVYQVRVRLHNDGQDQADSARVLAYSKNNLSIFGPVATINFPPIPGATSKDGLALLNVTAPGISGLADTLFARIIGGKSQNTGFSAPIVPATRANDSTAIINIESPAALKVSAMTFSQESVPANSNEPWYIYVHVNNSGTAPLLLDAISSSDITIAPDYIIVPEPFSPADSILYRAQNDASLVLAYKVVRTGAEGGQKAVRVDLTGNDLNNPVNKPGATFATPINVSTTAKVQITSTVVVNAPNYNASNDIAHLNTGQTFEVEVTVNNRGAEDLDSVWVALETQNSRFIGPNSKLVEKIPVGNNAKLIFNLRAASTENLPGEILVSQLVSAKGSISKIAAQEVPSSDSNTIIKIYQPANLVLQSTENLAPNPERTVSFQQQFPIRLIIKNNGTENVANVRVNLSVDNHARIITTPMPFVLPQGISGHDSVIVDLLAQADTTPGIANFTASIVGATGLNTGQPATISSSIDDTTVAIVERPAMIRVKQVLLSVEEVIIGKPWNITAVVENTGDADLQLRNLVASNIKVIIDGKDRVPGAGEYAGYFINPPTQLKISKDSILSAGATDSLIYSIVETGKYTGNARVQVHVSAYDLNIGLAGAVEDSNFVNVNVTSDAWVRIANVSIETPRKEDGKGFVNQNQLFAIHVTVETSDIQDVDSVMIRLGSDGSSFAVDENGQNQHSLPDIIVYLNRIPKNSNKTITFYLQAHADLVTGDKDETFIAEILKARLPDGNKRASIRTPREGYDRAHVHIQSQAELYLTFNFEEPDNVFSAGESFRLVAQVENNGTASTGTGRVILTYPDHYTLTGDRIRHYNINQEIYYNFVAPTTTSLNDTFIVSILDTAKDLNSNKAAAISAGGYSAQLILSTRESSVEISGIQIYSPDGAKDGILSSGQDCWVQVNFTASYDLTGTKVVLSAPGFNIIGNDTLDIYPDDDYKQWRLGAPDSSLADTELIAIAWGYTGKRVKKLDRDTLIVQVVTRAELQIENFEIVAPEGARDQIFTRGQDSIMVRARVTNRGVALIDTNTNASLMLDLKDSDLSFSGTDSSKKMFKIGNQVEWYLTAPNKIISKKIIEVRFEDVPYDENTNKPAYYSRKNPTIEVSTEEGGSITINSYRILSPEGATDDTISTEQKFTVAGYFSAKNLEQNEVIARIFCPDEFELLRKEIQVVNVSEGQVLWDIRAPKDPSITWSKIYTTIAGSDRNNNAFLRDLSDTLKIWTEERTKFKLSAKIVDSPGASQDIVSTEQKFKIKVRVENRGTAPYVVEDGFVVKVDRPTNYLILGAEDLQMIDSSTEDPWATFEFQAPSEPSEGWDVFSFRLIQYPRDSNSDEAALNLDVDGIDYKVQTVKKAELSLLAGVGTPENENATVWIGRKFDIVTGVKNTGKAEPDHSAPDGFRFKINLPGGYALVNSDTVQTSNTGRATWTVQAPSIPTNEPDTIILAMIDVPPDQYSGIRAAVTDSIAHILVNVKNGVLLVQDYQTTGPQVSALRGQSNLHVLGLRLENPGNTDSDEDNTIKIRRVSFKFKNDRDHNRPVSPRALLSGIRMVKHGFPDVIYAGLTGPEIPETNPIDLYFNLEQLSISSNMPDSVDVLIDILKNTTVPGFSVSIDSSSHIDAVDEKSDYPLRVGKEVSAPLGNHQINISSSFRALMTTSAPRQGFVNYPNPFGASDKPITKFWYYLEKDAQVELRIYSLAGEFVWAVEYGPTDRQGQSDYHEGDITWDGRNGNGNLVRNGIYIAYLLIDGKKSYTTKVAVAK